MIEVPLNMVAILLLLRNKRTFLSVCKARGVNRKHGGGVREGTAGWLPVSKENNETMPEVKVLVPALSLSAFAFVVQGCLAQTQAPTPPGTPWDPGAILSSGLI